MYHACCGRGPCIGGPDNMRAGTNTWVYQTRLINQTRTLETASSKVASIAFQKSKKSLFSVNSAQICWGVRLLVGLFVGWLVGWSAG